jgi:hypothetical protein
MDNLSTKCPEYPNLEDRKSFRRKESKRAKVGMPVRRASQLPMHSVVAFIPDTIRRRQV